MQAKDSLKTDKSQGAENLSAALALAADGIAVFPVGPDKRPLVKGWQEKATTDPDQIEAWWRDRPNAMPALPTGKRNGVAVLDVDQKNGKDGFAELLALGLDVDSLSDTQVASAGDGRHIFFEWPEGMGNSAAGLPPGLDVRGEGGFVVAPGAVNGKGSYRLLSGSLTAKLPPWPDDLPIKRKAVDAGEARPTGLPWPVFVEAVRAVPNDIKDRELWVARLAAIHAESGGGSDGLELAHQWSAQHHSNDPAETDRVWASFKRSDGATGWRFISEAERRGWSHPAVTELRQAEAVALLDAAWSDEEMGEIDRRSAELSKAEWKTEMRRKLDAEGLALLGLSPSRLTFLSPADCEDLPARNYVIKGLLGEGDIAAIVGAPGAGKSLLAPYLGFAVAQGAEAFGRRTRQGRVFYVAAEDSHGMRARVRALRDQLGDADAFNLVEGVSDLLSEGSEDLKALMVAVEDQRPALIVIDTLAVAFPGLEENDAKAMGTVVAVARRLARWGAAVVLVHHATKDGSNGLPRGHSILNGALDMNLYLKREDGTVTGMLTKNRNGSTDEKLAFTVATIPLGEDEDGDTITTAICRETDSADSGSREVKLSPSANAALTVFHEIGDGAPVAESIWRERAIEGRRVSAADDRDGRRRTFKRAVEELTRKNVLVFRDGRFATGQSPEALLGDDDV
ncbi:Primase C terminal 2 (PriCT-2) [Roseovarius azorensis]|uniref:Primase C terminal 2 (PriCT-2) n=1 Tax=Roseovarius azorensis TaxID=1287727 RepID=A0A1H7TQL7_9RHOB|nr:AAA family ATPase [Roseovarius azorensis]SEL86978.1 Primase C terminal 2 (PriCT-2) [Roseovarius azorensis]